jgi:O-acetyl-ADP-ribose deacetylase (regulator of RNase III)
MDQLLRYRIGANHWIELVPGDITGQETDAIVNAANSGLLGGGGVDGAIHRAAGPSLLEECKKIKMQRGSLPAGKAVGTTGGLLKARFVIHTVGPIWQGGRYNEPQILENCYCNSMAEAERFGCTTISFPSIATGAYRYPVPAAAQIAVRTIAELLHQGKHSIATVRFVLFEKEIFDRYVEAMHETAEHYPQYRIGEEPVSL